MNPFLNIWQHPKTSVAGVLIAVVTIAGVLSQQGVTLGSLGSGTVVSFVGALAAALLGLLAKDPGSQSGNSSGTSKLGAWMLVALLLSGTLPTSGCSRQSVAQQIVNWTPSLQSAVAAVNSLASALTPEDEAIFQTATASFNAVSNLLVVQARAYLADPSAGTLHQLQSQIVALQQQVNTALLAAARISNPTSQQHVLAGIQAVATIATAILALVQTVSSKSDIKRMAAQAVVKMAAVEPYLDRDAAARMVAAHYGEPIPAARQQVIEAEAEMMRAGF